MLEYPEIFLNDKKSVVAIKRAGALKLFKNELVDSSGEDMNG